MFVIEGRGIKTLDRDSEECGLIQLIKNQSLSSGFLLRRVS